MTPDEIKERAERLISFTALLDIDPYTISIWDSLIKLQADYSAEKVQSLKKSGFNMQIGRSNYIEGAHNGIEIVLT